MLAFCSILTHNAYFRFHPSIHPFMHYLFRSALLVLWWRLTLFPAVIGGTLNRSPAYHRANPQRQPFTHTLTTNGRFRVTNQADEHVFEKWKEVEVSRKNSCMHRENMQPSQKKQEPSWYKATEPLHPTVQLGVKNIFSGLKLRPW